MYVYIESERGLWTAGFYDPQGAWQPESDHASKEEAAARVHYLNGGSTVFHTDTATYTNVADEGL